jgi:3-hydroxyisobutyrate dehydrogenase/2-hydroxy-3-oxopropionate reductase
MHKDIGLMLDHAAELNVPLPLTSLSRQMFQMAISSGYGDDDMCGTIRVLEELSRIEVKKS